MADEVLLPQPWGVLYARPNPDDSRKSCWNCMMWISQEKGCGIHAPDIRVTAEMVCGYHVFGRPMKDRMEHPDIDYVDPATSGLDTVEGGTSCDVCRYYEAENREAGKCWAVADAEGYTPIPVQALGCCARWESIREE